MEPYLRRYERLVQRPSVVSAERSADTPFPELAGMRRIARAEAYLMREELRQKRYRAAIARADRLSRLAEQARNGGPLIHYLVGLAIHSIALQPIREELPRIQDRAALEALLKLARDYEKRRLRLCGSACRRNTTLYSAYIKNCWTGASASTNSPILVLLRRQAPREVICCSINFLSRPPCPN
jgi:hypothetical protein